MPLKNNQVELRFDPIGDVMLPSIRDWDLYQRVITFRFYRIEGERLRRDGIYAHSDDMEDTKKVISSFLKRIEGNYPVARMKILWDYFINVMNSGPGSLHVGLFFGLDGIIQLEGYERDQVNFNGCVIACWRRYIAALRKENVKLMALFLKRLIMPQVDTVLYNLRILNKHQTVVFRTEVEDSDSLEVNPAKERDQALELAEPVEHEETKVSEATAVNTDKGKGKHVALDAHEDKSNRTGLEGIGLAQIIDKPGPEHSDLPITIRPGTGVYSPMTGEPRKNGAFKDGKGYGGGEHIEGVSSKRLSIYDKPLPEFRSPTSHVSSQGKPLGEAGSASVTLHQKIAPKSGRLIIKSTLHGCKKSVVDMKNKIANVTGRKFKTKLKSNFSEEGPADPQEEVVDHER
ncbi:hypothetical protein TWF718_007911 [Orbilia javanica]|uniref:Uncharacterized protein n=1 Tax=Orbilia javanica TaxID=47235 RepID=A0AAN8RCQ1_9PEZI